MNAFRAIFLWAATIVAWVSMFVAVILGFLTLVVGGLAAVWWVITSLVNDEGTWFIHWNKSLTITMIVLVGSLAGFGIGAVAIDYLDGADWRFSKWKRNYQYKKNQREFDKKYPRTNTATRQYSSQTYTRRCSSSSSSTKRSSGNSGSNTSGSNNPSSGKSRALPARPTVNIDITPEGNIKAGPFQTEEEAMASIETIQAIRKYVQERNEE